MLDPPDAVEPPLELATEPPEDVAPPVFAVPLLELVDPPVLEPPFVAEVPVLLDVLPPFCVAVLLDAVVPPSAVPLLTVLLLPPAVATGLLPPVEAPSVVGRPPVAVPNVEDPLDEQAGSNANNERYAKNAKLFMARFA